MNVARTDEPAADPLDELRALRQRQDRLSKAKRALITEARRRDTSWTAIADALGVTKEAVFALYKDQLRSIESGAVASDELSDEQALERERAERALLAQAPTSERP